MNNFNLMSILSECLIDVKSGKKATNTKNKFVKDVCKYALYAIGVFLLGIYTALEYGIFAHYILVCSFECIGGTRVHVHYI